MITAVNTEGSGRLRSHLIGSRRKPRTDTAYEWGASQFRNKQIRVNAGRVDYSIRTCRTWIVVAARFHVPTPLRRMRGGGGGGGGEESDGRGAEIELTAVPPPRNWTITAALSIGATWTIPNANPFHTARWPYDRCTGACAGRPYPAGRPRGPVPSLL